MSWRCLLTGHRPFRFINTFFVVCERCEKRMRITEGAPR